MYFSIYFEHGNEKKESRSGDNPYHFSAETKAKETKKCLGKNLAKPRA